MPTTPQTHFDLELAFWSKVQIQDGCWVWCGSTDSDGYGKFCIAGIIFSAHRFSRIGLVGPIPEGLVIDHTCRNRLCVNPAHMEVVTNKINVLRGVGPTAINAAKTHCKVGHPLSGDNLRTRPDGRRECITCRRQYYRTRRQQARQKKFIAA